MGYICCFTGHRDIDLRHSKCLAAVMDDTVERLIAAGVTVFRAGGALGFDTVAALKVIEKKKKYPNIALHLYLPCKDQSKNWEDYSVGVYNFVLSQADEINYTTETYRRGCMLLRNRQLVNGSDFCVSYCQKNSGGTAYTVNYAKERNVKIINIAKMCDDTLNC